MKEYYVGRLNYLAVTLRRAYELNEFNTVKFLLKSIDARFSDIMRDIPLIECGAVGCFVMILYSTIFEKLDPRDRYDVDIAIESIDLVAESLGQ